MSKGVNVRITGKLLNFIELQTAPQGMYESASEYIRDLIRHDFEKSERQKWGKLSAELTPGMQAAKNEFLPLNMDAIISEAKNEHRQK